MERFDAEQKMSRRTLLISASAYSALESLSIHKAVAARLVGAAAPAEPNFGKQKICIFSKHLQWADVGEAAEVAKEIGFDGIDLTVRAGGHVLPEKVEADLPSAVATIRSAGLEVPMITTDITPANGGMTERVLKAAAAVGIHRYRWGELIYRTDTSIADQLDALKPSMRRLADINRRYGVCGMYHTHSGPGRVGGPIWDLWYLFRDLDPQWMGVNYDIGHATVEGGYGGWQASSELVKDWMRGIALKDFTWAKNGKGSTQRDPFDKALGVEGAYVPHWCPIGEGMVNFVGFFAIVKRNAFSGPIQLHFEYPGLGGAQNGNKTLDMSKADLVARMRADLTAVRQRMQRSQLG